MQYERESQAKQYVFMTDFDRKRTTNRIPANQAA